MSNWIFPYKSGSKSVKALSKYLGAKQIKAANSRFKAKEGKLVVNWGASSIPDNVAPSVVVNQPIAVKVASNKLSAFRVLKDAGVHTVPFTDNLDEATKWGGESIVVARHKLSGHSGEGIELVAPGSDIPKAPLYTLYVKKKEEYRIHILNGQVIHVQRKARKKDVPAEDVNWQVRNHANGFIYQIEGVEVAKAAEDLAINAVEHLGLDMGAVDIIWNEKSNTYYVLEVNTAPGLEGTTLQKYGEALKHFLKNRV